MKNDEVEKHLNKNREEGASMVEYALLLALLVIVALVGVRATGQKVSGTFSSISSVLH